MLTEIFSFYRYGQGGDEKESKQEILNYRIAIV